MKSYYCVLLEIIRFRSNSQGAGANWAVQRYTSLGPKMGIKNVGFYMDSLYNFLSLKTKK